MTKLKIFLRLQVPEVRAIMGAIQVKFWSLQVANADIEKEQMATNIFANKGIGR